MGCLRVSDLAIPNTSNEVCDLIEGVDSLALDFLEVKAGAIMPGVLQEEKILPPVWIALLWTKSHWPVNLLVSASSGVPCPSRFWH